MTYLVEHATENVWCTPEQDKQAIMELRRLTFRDGAWINVDILKRRYRLPNTTGRFHVFSIGQLFPEIIGLFPFVNVWTTLADCSTLQKMMADVYTTSGIRLPSSFIWYRWTEDKALVIAIEEKSAIPIKYGTDKIYLQVYSDAYFKTQRASASTESVTVYGKIPATKNEVLSFQMRVNNLKALGGRVITFVNGFYCDSVSLLTAKPGDVLELIHDTSIEQVLTINVGSLDTFNSEMDKIKKYLIHFAKTNEEPRTIRYIDDIYIYLAKKDSSGTRRGVFYHKNDPASIRMLTHRDYSISVDNVVSLTKTDPKWQDPETMDVVIYFRKSGYLRNLVYDTNRIHELYKLSEIEVKRAMVGFDSNVSVWRAEHLEQSAYIELMHEVKMSGITPDTVEKAYGYNAISSLIGFTPKKTEVSSGQTLSKLPLAAAVESAVFEYDYDGHLYGWRNNAGQQTFACSTPSITYVEALVGQSASGYDEQYGQTVTLDPNYSYRFYAKREGETKWIDMTDTEAVVITGNTAEWTLDMVAYKTVVRSDRKMVVYEITLNPNDGLFDLVLVQEQDKGNGLHTYQMEIPPGEIDLFFNNRMLIEKLDYFVVFPKIVIVNKEYMVNQMSQGQRVVVRCRGFCGSDLSRQLPEDVGFVQYGMLSRNTIFNLREDRVMRVVVDGAIYTRDEVTYVEGSTGTTVGNSVNGKPYMVKEITVPMKAFTPSDTYRLRDAAHAVNAEISDYLSLKIPEPERKDIFTVQRRYYTFSPFFAKIMFDMLNGVLNDSRIKEHCSDMTVREICSGYEYLLAFDPCMDENRPDTHFVNVHPHHYPVVIDIDPYVFKFMSAVNRVFLQDRLDLSSFLRLVF